MVTIKDVARKANVSTATVSRILNNQPGFSEKTKIRVLEIIDELSYKPNAVARSLISRNTQTIGVLFPNVSSMLSSEILHGIEDVAHNHDSSVIVCHTASDGIRTNKYLKLLHEKRVDGLIFVSETLKEDYYETIQHMNIPLVLVSTMSYQHDVPYVKVDDRHAAFTGTKFLINKGHQRVGMISGPIRDPIAGTPRIAGFQDALIQHNFSVSQSDIVHENGFSFQNGKNAIPKLLKQAPDLTAIFAASDEMAIGAISALNQLGKRVPEDVSIIGYDNLQTSEMTIPPLTTVAQPFSEMGANASEMIFDMLDNGTHQTQNRIMRHEIIERESVRSI
ncbi:LacI family DNA-binding transcriptional regulator [Alkalihalobacillus sp. AL-G]|uniref:LacI family DNA-binding transcriptional regulator n=1 Tax=Alkalihalobacillus sp. AL-G TaxID=2926399 RepID=UPI00272BF627|nr:substrate-binding domain-containing protein [Alkalihalobacillus sp. AL-G]WLD91652.1 substrate-binding domain-containing protein [Alkalihalobacillus sp. AL-G]